jgi:hypothetical protein
MWKSEFDIPSSNAILLAYTHPFAQGPCLSRITRVGSINMHARLTCHITSTGPIPTNRRVPSCAPSHPWVGSNTSPITPVAPMGRLQHLADYTRRRTSHTCPHPDSSAHGHLFHPGTQQGSPPRLPSVARPSCRYQGACAIPNTARATWEPRVSRPQAYSTLSAVLGEVRRHRTLPFHQYLCSWTTPNH